MAGLNFEEIVRNLLVYLKGQIPSMNSKNTKEEIVRQLQSITFTLRTTIVQLEGAAFNDPKGSTEYQQLKDELKALKATNSRLEESLFLEMNKTKSLSDQIKQVEKLDQERENEVRDLLDKYNQKETELNKLIEENKELANKTVQSETDTSQLKELQEKIDDLENQLTASQSNIRDLKQTLQNKDIELAKAKESLMKAMELDNDEIQSLQAKLEESDKQEKEILILQKKIDELTEELSEGPSKEVYQNKLAAAEARIKFLTESISDIKSQANLISKEDLNILQSSKQELEHRVIDLEAALRKTIKAKEVTTTDTSTTFRTEESVFLFDTLFSTMKRFQSSPENKDIFQKAKESIELLEKNRAIHQIKSLGQIYDPKFHTVIKSYKCDFLQDGMIIHEESPGFASGNKIIQKAVVYINKSEFTCTECGYECKERDLFCPKCGLELASPDGTSKKEIQQIPSSVEFNLPLVDALTRQQELTTANALAAMVAREHPDNPEIVKRQQNLLLLTNSNNQAKISLSFV